MIVIEPLPEELTELDWTTAVWPPLDPLKELTSEKLSTSPSTGACPTVPLATALKSDGYHAA